MSNDIITVTDRDFEEQVLRSETPVLVDFWAEWCGPCHMVAPVVEEIAHEQAGRLRVVKLNIDESPTTAQQFGVMSIPTLILFSGGGAGPGHRGARQGIRRPDPARRPGSLIGSGPSWPSCAFNAV